MQPAPIPIEFRTALVRAESGRCGMEPRIPRGSIRATQPVINDINERALGLTGEAALGEDGDSVIVRLEVLSQVIEAWSA